MKRRDLEIVRVLGLLTTPELVGELKRRAVFCVEGRLDKAISTPFPPVIKPHEKVAILVVRAQ